MMAALFALFIIELVLKSKTGGHSHGGPTGQGLASRGAPPGTTSPPVYSGRPDTAMTNAYPDEKASPYIRYPIPLPEERNNAHVVQFN
jgi:solute carrier family 39 (zinc transporter), member 1/2/3